MGDCREVRANARDAGALDPHATRRALAAVAAILVAATALASCADTGDRAAPEATNVGATPTVTTTTAPPTPTYVTVPSRPLADGIPKYAANAEPGVFAVRLAPGDTGGCTLGPAVTAGGRPAFLTAGHCRGGGAPLFASTGPGAEDVRELGPAVRAVNEKNDPGADGILDDRALVYTGEAAGDRTIAGFPVAGSLTLKETRLLPAGTPICVAGAVSGIRCGGLISASRDRIEFAGKVGATAPNKGDSGAPVFVVDENGRATVIGLVTSEAPDGAMTNATFIEPALQDFGAQLVTAG